MQHWRKKQGKQGLLVKIWQFENLAKLWIFELIAELLVRYPGKIIAVSVLLLSW